MYNVADYKNSAYSTNSLIVDIVLIHDLVSVLC